MATININNTTISEGENSFSDIVSSYRANVIIIDGFIRSGRQLHIVLQYVTSNTGEDKEVDFVWRLEHNSKLSSKVLLFNVAMLVQR